MNLVCPGNCRTVNILTSTLVEYTLYVYPLCPLGVDVPDGRRRLGRRGHRALFDGVASPVQRRVLRRCGELRQQQGCRSRRQEDGFENTVFHST